MAKIQIWLIIMAIVVAPFVLLWQEVGPVWFLVIVVGIPVLVAVRWNPQKAFEKARAAKNQPTVPVVAEKSPSSERKIETYIRHDAEQGVDYIETDWPAQFRQIEQARAEKDFDFARLWLQKFAYTITGKADVPQEIKDRFKRVMTDFAEEDPLYREVMAIALPYILANPGTLQSKIYGHLPHWSEEEVRYVLYFANELGHIHRRKKGRSYELLPPGAVIDA